MIDTAVIIAGGKGLRLGSETADKPKAMVRVLGRPIIEWIILWLKKNGVSRVVISVDYKKEVLIKHVGDGSGLGVSVAYNDHGGCFETGDVFRHVLAHQNLPDTFFAMNGDQITDLPLQSVAAHHKEHAPTATIVICPVRVPYGIVELTESGHVHNFREKPVLPDLFMNTGIYVFNKTIAPHLPERGFVEKDTFTKLAAVKQLKAYAHHGFYTTISNQKDIAEAEKQLQK